MENILRFIGRFLGEKIALLDTIYAKKGETGSAKGSGIYVVNGYVDSLPPRPVKGDKYIIKGEVPDLYTGIYNLNFGFNTHNRTGFKIVGDSQAQAAGANRMALFEKGEVKTGRIKIRQGGKMKLHIGINKMTVALAKNVSIEEYNSSGSLIKTGTLNVWMYTPVYYTPNLNTTEVRIRVTGNGGIYYIKVWDMLSSEKPDHTCMYCWNGNKWEKQNVPQGVIVGVKGKAFGLLPVFKGFRKVRVFHLPKVEIKGGLCISNNYIGLHKPTDQDYVLRLYVKRRRSVMLTHVSKKINRVKYSECLSVRRHNPIFVTQRPQTGEVLLSRLSVGRDQWELPYKWKNLVTLVFTKGLTIINRGPLVVPSKYYPSTGLHFRNKHKARNSPDYADFAMCYAKHIGGEWIEGERCYFRVMQKKGIAMEECVSVRVLK